MVTTRHYILFHNHTEGLALYFFLKSKDVQVRIAPAPRSVVSCCGMSLLVDEGDLERVRDLIDQRDIEIDRIVALENQVDPMRDMFC